MSTEILFVGAHADPGLGPRAATVGDLSDAHVALGACRPPRVLVVALAALGPDPLGRLRALTAELPPAAVALVTVPADAGDAMRRALVDAGAADVVDAGAGWQLHAALARCARLGDIAGEARRYRLLHTLSLEGYALLDRAGAVLEHHVVRAGPSGQAWPGFAAVAEPSAAAFRAALAAAAASPGEPVELPDAEMVDTAGDRHWVEIVLTDLVDEPSVAGVVLMYWDITTRVQAMQAVAFQANLLAAVAQAVIALDRADRIVYWNPAAAELYGWPAAEALGRPLHALLGSLEGPELVAIREAVGAGRRWAGEVQTTHRSGRRFPVALSVTPVRGEDGTVPAVILAATDVSERRTAEEGLRRLATVVESSGDAIVSFDRSGRVTTWNPAAERLYGWAPGEATDLGWVDLTPEAAREEVAEALAAVAADRTVDQLRTHQQRSDGSTVPVAMTLAPIRDGDRIVGSAAIVHDTTPEVVAAEERAAAEARFTAAFDQSSYGMALAGPDLRVTAVNRAVCQLFGRSEGELLGDGWARFAHPDDRSAVEDLRARAGTSLRRIAEERRFVRADGDVVAVQIDLNLVEDPSGGPAYYMVQLHDVTARRLVEAELEHRALHDDLTGLPNRTLIAERLDLALAEAGGQGVGVVFVDVDGFSHINDVLGHEAGDRVLVELGQRLRRAVRAHDTVGRFGGDEFVLVCQDVDVDELAALARRVTDTVEAPITLRGRRTPVRVGLGITMSRPGSTSASLLSEADAAVARAKELGRGQAAVFDESLRAKARALLEGEGALRAALDRGEVVPYFQPIVELASGRPVGFEALARWQRNGGTVAAAEGWIELAQRSGLIVELSELVLARAVAEAAEWQRRAPGQRLWVAVNLDASHLVEAHLPETVERVLTTGGLDPQLLHLEITETAVMQDLDASAAVLSALRELGVHLSVDDFGTGYSSLSYLRRLPVDTIKVDRSFVAELATERGDASIVRAVLGLGKALGLRCIAEGVETALQQRVLADLGCELGQGYLWSRALAAPDARAWLDEQLSS